MQKIFDTQSFIAKANLIHDNYYDYSKTSYINKNTKVIVICPVHKEFLVSPSNHLNGTNCRECAWFKRTFTTEKFIERARLAHGDKYDYSESVYVNNYTMIKIKCSEHGIFEQQTTDHWKGIGCNECAIEYRARAMSSTTEEFIRKSKIIHGDRYDYSLVEYINNKSKVAIICEKHGVFWQVAETHKSGHNCPACAGAGTSRAEKAWLDELGISIDQRDIKLPKLGRIRVDGFDPITNTVYEYYGDYWHGNPNRFKHNDINKSNYKTFGELYQKTLEREAIIKNAGYNLIVKWENKHLK